VRILCIGDVVGRPGRKALADRLRSLVQERGIDLVVVNAENAAGGSGLTPQIFKKLLRYGAHVVTLGDHLYRRAEICTTLKESDQIVRPANLPPDAVGRRYTVVEVGGHRVAIISLLGRMFMKPQADCPFRTADAILGELPEDVKTIVVDFHAEATGEKVALGRHLVGRVSVVFGTHTHVPTADEVIHAGHTAYISDVGMTGPYDSVLGRKVTPVIAAAVTGMPHPFDIADGDVRLCGIQVDVDPGSGAATAIERVCEILPEEDAANP
jgi:hypothetical protein